MVYRSKSTKLVVVAKQFITYNNRRNARMFFFWTFSLSKITHYRTCIIPPNTFIIQSKIPHRRIALQTRVGHNTHTPLDSWKYQMLNVAVQTFFHPWPMLFNTNYDNDVSIALIVLETNSHTSELTMIRTNGKRKFNILKLKI